MSLPSQPRTILPRRKESGFVLLEIVVAIGLIGMLAVSLNTLFLQQLQMMKFLNLAAANVEASNVSNGATIAYQSTGEWPTGSAELVGRYVGVVKGRYAFGDNGTIESAEPGGWRYGIAWDIETNSWH